MTLRIKELRKARGWTQEHLADLVGSSKAHISGMETGVKNPSTPMLQQLARTFGVEVPSMYDAAPPPHLNPAATDQPDDFLIPVYDVAASAGYGAMVESEDIFCNMAFDRRFLRRLTDAGTSHLSIIRVKGHSMEPTLLDDDHVLVDRTKRNLSYDGLFVLRFDDALHVKRIGRSATRGNVTVTSDHPAYRDLDMPMADLEIIGRVLWVGRKV